MQNQLGLTCVFAMSLTLFASVDSQAASRDRIVGPVDSSHVTVVPGTAHRLASTRYDRGRMYPGRIITRASLALRLSSAQQSALDQLLRDQQDPASPIYHKWLSPEDYAQRFGVSDNDLGTITSWLQSRGLHVEDISESRTEISFRGTVGQIEHAFQTEMHDLTVNGEQHFANLTDVQVPVAFANLVLGVRKLNDFEPRPHLRKPSPHFTSSVSGNHFIAPGDFATIYDVSPLYTQGLDGAGQTIAVIGQTDINVSDAHAFRAASGLSVNDPIKVLVPNTGTATTCTGDLDEANLDVEWTGAVAKSASIMYVFAGPGTNATCSNRTSNVFDALQYAINNKVAPVISMSYGDCETRIGSSTSQTFRQWTQQANAQGQTITAAAGDDGAADCDFNDTSATQGLAVDVPASIPEVTGIGGTAFTGDSAAPVANGCASATTYWGQSCSLTSGPSALSYIPETTWNDPPSSSSFSATGGGASKFFAKPSWQTGPGVPNDNARDVPDVSLSASPTHDAYLVCTQGSCTNGYRDSSNGLSAVGGTSVGAPAFAGILAIINQATGSSGVGNANSSLYSLAVSTPSAFHDVTTGDNKVPCTAGSTGCPNGGTIGFAATANYDQTTGLGTIDAFNLVTAWPGFVPTPGFSIAANPLSFTVAVGASGSSTVTVAGTNGFTGSVNLSCAVPANTTNITCAMSPSSVALSSTTTSGTATLTINGVALANSSASGRQVLAAGLMVPGLCLLGLPFMKAGGKKWAGMLALCLLGFLNACGGGSSSSSQNHHTVQTYAVTVTGTSGATSHPVTVNVTE
jgi:subtilase family serine protease